MLLMEVGLIYFNYVYVDPFAFGFKLGTVNINVLIPTKETLDMVLMVLQKEPNLKSNEMIYIRMTRNGVWTSPSPDTRSLIHLSDHYQICI